MALSKHTYIQSRQVEPEANVVGVEYVEMLTSITMHGIIFSSIFIHDYVTDWEM